MSEVALPFFTIGHSNRSQEDFIALLTGGGIALVADIRKIPRSRTNPQFNKEVLPDALAASGIAYEHMEALGGRRGKVKGMPPDINRLWMNGSFHNYADYALSEDFATALAHLRAEGHRQRTALMCSEAVWWRCHRRIVSDYLIAHGEVVCHIMGPAPADIIRLETARLTPGAIVRPDGTVVYPPLPSKRDGALEIEEE